jgi:hypothetical protein
MSGAALLGDQCLTFGEGMVVLSFLRVAQGHGTTSQKNGDHRFTATDLIININLITF